MIYILLYIGIMNLFGLWIMKKDKNLAREHKYRIPERTLFLVSLIGGSLGTWMGMYLFHHKTKHWYFVLGMPVIFFCQIGICYVIYI